MEEALYLTGLYYRSTDRTGWNSNAFGLIRIAIPLLLSVAEKTKGYSHALVQELVVCALLKALNAGREVTDQDLIDSTQVMREQYKAQAKSNGDLPNLDKVGFHAGDS